MIYISGHYLNRRTSGLARYALQIAGALDDYGLVPIVLPHFLKVNSMIRKVSLILLESLYSAFILAIAKDSKYISPAFSVPLFNSARVIVVVHDLAFLDYPDCYSRLENVYFRSNLFLLKVFSRIKIVVPSCFVECDIIARLGISENRVSIISPYGLTGPSHSDMASETAGVSVPTTCRDRYVLLVSNGHPRKNIDATIVGYLNSDLPAHGIRLVLIGAFERELLPLSDTAVEVRNNVSDDELIALYQGAYGVGLFSLNEGFGIPVLEAATFGVPCVHSNTTGLLSFDLENKFPKDVTSPQQIASRLNTLLDSSLREDYVALGKKIAETFNQDTFNHHWRELVGVNHSSP